MAEALDVSVVQNSFPISSRVTSSRLSSDDATEMTFRNFSPDPPSKPGVVLRHDSTLEYKRRVESSSDDSHPVLITARHETPSYRKI